jgi:hypothetical protein
MPFHYNEYFLIVFSFLSTYNVIRLINFFPLSGPQKEGNRIYWRKLLCFVDGKKGNVEVNIWKKFLSRNYLIF